MNASVRKFLVEEDGVTALEYGLLAAVIAGILVAVGKKEIQGFFENLFEKLGTVVDDATAKAST
ncbi:MULTISPECIES: Flp family type IVb pilin [Stenotrophomonas]|uniref:Pilus assembly protein Flp/PilA n=1 Tax=Stenotrophomonas rhizophila TaxID=216778 RepID=A0A498CLV3_9GAMM|nr:MULTISPECIES: Flp family type IVb pilin [Stenotrophomonas]MBU2049981.1 Flp family type IVb pilin [Gammaproteobacteria bacterium]RLK56114.1 pilus assembly protein Flp/PilA [Stenotrophomonas rhizophila]